MAFEDTFSADLKSLWNRTRPRRRSSVLLEVYSCDAEGCSHRNVQFKTTPLFVEVLCDVEGGRTSAICFDCF